MPFNAWQRMKPQPRLRRCLAWLLCLLPIPVKSLAAAAARTVTGDEDFTEMSLEELGRIRVPTVVGASLFAQKATEAPSSISVITQEEFKRYGHRTLAEALQSLQGFHVSYDRNYSFLGARGVSLGDFNSRTLLLIDGHRVNDNLTDGAYLGSEFLLDVDLIESVEVIRGPGSAIYGNNAFFGVINVVTRRGRQLDGIEFSGEYASFNTYKGRVTVGKSLASGLEFLFSGTYFDSAGPDELHYPEFDTPDRNNGIATRKNDESHGSLFGSLRLGDFTLQGGHIIREKGNPTAQYLTTFNDARLRTEDERSYVDLRYEHEFSGELNVNAHVYYDRSGYAIGYPFGDPVAVALFEEVHAGEWWGAELQASKRLSDKHLIAAGAEYRDDFGQKKRVFDQFRTYTDLQGSRRSHGIYLQGDFALRSDLHVNGGVRYDKYGDFDPSLNPRFGLIYHLFPESTLKALYGSAFRAPNFIEQSDRRFQDLHPERITSYELVHEQGIGKNLRSSVAGYFNRLDDVIVFENGAFANVNAESRGLELALEGLWEHGLRTRASYSLQSTENRSAGRRPPDSPEHLFKVNLSVPLLADKLFGSLEYQFTSSRHTVFTSGAETLPGRDAAEFGVFNLTLFSRDLLRNLEASVSVYNLLDDSHADPASRFHRQDQLSRDGRTFRVKLNYRF
ncbi:MAG TPA: TonB-dependent receptor [Verrucomicrobiales bacterium]|nr:TonB-dependent receptor [Verrucomicrobiales bacterium]